MKKGLLLGAGFSFDLGMPTAYELTEIFLGLFDRRNTHRLVAGLGNHQPYSADRPISKTAIAESFELLLDYKDKKGGNYEELLANIQGLSEQPSKPQPEKDSHHFIFSVFYEIIHTILSIYQDKSYEILFPINKEWFAKISNLLSENETWVFSLNHDLFFEFLSIDLGIPVSYGDTGSIEFPVSNIEMHKVIPLSYTQRKDCGIHSTGFFSGRRGVNLVKLHGSLSELQYKDGSLICNPVLTKRSSLELMGDLKKIERMGYYVNNIRIPSGRDRFVTNSNGEMDIVCKSMLTGGKKYSTTAKEKDGEEKLKIFDDVLRQLDELTIIGYGFGDKHVNFRISNAMARRDDFRVQIVDPFRNKAPEFLQPFDYDSKIRLAMCGAAHWMDYCKSNTWDSRQIEALKENTKYRTEIKKSVQDTLQRIYKF
ncbi:hypothetical protein K788_0003274 [Paraburkholderia caribensis MBA4]|uniref:SIR2-like domain-containing protein n=1 Tax=Paraburkholderia caribensis MBA4 TaxID=1323664 RepID=A0A0N7JUD9_9BURK|nr:hypothetical protein [Paraburkholderia caribensis]ALL66141.1 hypothetical protein K788_0003274 [Paraburkholderia caribensis MBA4]